MVHYSNKNQKNPNFILKSWHFEKKLLTPNLARGLNWLLPCVLDMWLPKYVVSSLGIIFEASKFIWVPVYARYERTRDRCGPQICLPHNGDIKFSRRLFLGVFRCFSWRPFRFLSCLGSSDPRSSQARVMMHKSFGQKCVVVWVCSLTH